MGSTRGSAPGRLHGGDVADMLRQAGEVGQALLAVDWRATPLGLPESWPRPLATMIQALLGSRFSMWMAWGPELTFFCNDAYRRDTLGRKYPWALGRPASEVWAEIWPDLAPRVEAVMRTGVATWDEALLLFLERSGWPEETYHTFSYSPLTDEHGTVAGLLCVVSEDTERVIAQRRMATLRDLGSDPTTVRTQEEVLAAAAAHLGANRQSLPFTLTYLFDDGADTAALAASSGGVDGHPIAPALVARDAASPWPVAELAAGASVVVELEPTDPPLPTGAWPVPPLQALAVPLPQQGVNRPYGFLVAGVNRFRPLDEGYRDFVGLVASQIAAGIASARAYDTERRRAEQLAELDRAKTAFFTNISHELRTPLTLLLAPAEDALADRQSPLSPQQRPRIEVLHRNGQRLLRLVNTLLDFNRLQSGRANAHYEPLDLARYTAELTSMFDSAVLRAGLELEIDCPPLSAPVFVDREMWAKIVLNLLSNALKFTFDGGIAVRLREADGRARLTVADTGIGITPEEQDRLFERFHRVTGARSRTHEGSGIGLALVAELAELHGGQAAVHSVPGEGSSFTVEVPLGSDHLPAEELATAPADEHVAEREAEGFVTEALRWLEPEGTGAAPAAPAVDDDRARILVVDDNADMRDYVATLLSGTYAVQTAPDGAAALDAVRENPPDLVLTDVMMPRLDGFGLLEALRADPATLQIPVIMLSARAGEDGPVEGLEAGADDYLAKPFAARELLARVHANLELERVRSTRDQLRRSEALLDQAQRLAAVGSWEIELATGALRASGEFLRQLRLDPEELARPGGATLVTRRVHPDDRGRLLERLAAANRDGTTIDEQVRIVTPDGSVRTLRGIGEVDRDSDGRPVRLRGSSQDITDQIAAEQALAAVAAEREAAAREHRIADQLQRSLLPDISFDPDQLRVATYYRPGVEGTRVGGDWYDLIDLGERRTAVVIGDVMGRGVRAAAVMGQLRAAVRAYARLDLPPARLLEELDGVVRDLGEDQIVTCVYGVYDPGAATFTYANAGHLPPLLWIPGSAPRRLTGSAGALLGSGPIALEPETVQMPPGALLVLYTDGLVERRDRRIDAGIDDLADRLAALHAGVAEMPELLVGALAPDVSDDDVAVLIAGVPPDRDPPEAVREVEPGGEAVREARQFTTDTLGAWGIRRAVTSDAVLLVSEMVTNAILHGSPPVRLRLRRTSAEELEVAVHDGAQVEPQPMTPTDEDEHGRGLQLVAMLSREWGTEPGAAGKTVWCRIALG